MSEREIEELDDQSVTLELDDGSSVNCDVLAIYPVDEQFYIALLPTDGPDAETGEVYLYRYDEDESNVPQLSNIESDEEFEIASEAFDELLDAEEFDEIVDGEEE